MVSEISRSTLSVTVLEITSKARWNELIVSIRLMFNSSRFTNRLASFTKRLSPTSFTSPVLMTEVHDYVLADLFNFGFGKVWVTLPDDFRNQYFVGRLSIDAPCSSPCEGIILKDDGLEVVKVRFDDLLGSCCGGVFEIYDLQRPWFRGIVVFRASL